MKKSSKFEFSICASAFCKPGFYATCTNRTFVANFWTKSTARAEPLSSVVSPRGGDALTSMQEKGQHLVLEDTDISDSHPELDAGAQPNPHFLLLQPITELTLPDAFAKRPSLTRDDKGELDMVAVTSPGTQLGSSFVSAWPTPRGAAAALPTETGHSPPKRIASPRTISPRTIDAKVFQEVVEWCDRENELRAQKQTQLLKMNTPRKKEGSVPPSQASARKAAATVAPAAEQQRVATAPAAEQQQVATASGSRTVKRQTAAVIRSLQSYLWHLVQIGPR